MELFKLFWIVFVVGQFVSISTPFNPLLTYSFRHHKLTAVPNITVNYTIDQYREKQFFNGHITFDTVKLIDKVVCIFYRCNRGGVNCEYFQTWVMTDICTKLKNMNELWDKWYSSFIPPLNCPIDKVNYVFKNGTFDVGAAIRWYPQCTDYDWKLTQKMYAGDVFLGSYTVHSSFFGYRKKINLFSGN